MNTPKNYQLSEDGLVTFLEIDQMVESLKWILGLSNTEIYDLLRDGQRKHYEASEHHKSENILAYIMVREFISDFTDLKPEFRMDVEDSMGRIMEMVNVKNVPKDKLLGIKDSVKTQYGFYSVPDLGIFIDQGFFILDPEERFREILHDAFNHDIWNKDFLVEQEEKILDHFDRDAKIDLIDIYEQDIPSVHASIIKKVLKFYGNILDE